MDFRSGGVYSYTNLKGEKRLWLAVYVEFSGTYYHVGYTDEMEPFTTVRDMNNKNEYKISINPLSKKVSCDLPENARLIGTINVNELAAYEKAFSENHKKRFKL